MTQGSNQPETRGNRNWLILLGLALMLAGFFGAVFFLLLEALLEAAPYVGIVYMGFIGIVVLGFVLIPIGLMRRRGARTEGTPPGVAGVLASIRVEFDLAKRTHLYVALGLMATGAVVLCLVGFGTYKSYQATESASFCGELCHSVMHPEWTTYQLSSHARVKCVECHIGAGADWFVRSKLSGLRQVWAVSVNSYSRPIPTPIHDLRPARETCEECHWPRKFIGYKELVRPYFLSDKESTPYRLRMLLKIGGERTGFMKGSGIHYHMIIAAKVEYIATDPRRQEIAWVRVTRNDGSVTEFDREDDPLTEAAKATMEVRTMDCMDCHNRPAHQFPTPMGSVNLALEQEAISRDLPYIKVQAVKSLNSGYKSQDEAMKGIANYLRRYYRENYPEVLENGSEELTQAIREVQAIYSRSIFPVMDADWSAYPNNIGHHYSPGCFRCHNDSMTSAEGETIFTTCDKCHLILAQGESIDEVNVDFREGLPFIHPDDDEPIEEYEECVECHDGGGEVYE